MTPSKALRLAIMTTLVMSLTGFVVIPFTSKTAGELLLWAGFERGSSFDWMAAQVENIVYAVGRVPLLFAVFMAFSPDPQASDWWVYAAMGIGIALIALGSGWVEVAGFVCVVSGLVVRVSAVWRQKSRGMSHG